MIARNYPNSNTIRIIKPRQIIDGNGNRAKRQIYANIPVPTNAAPLSDQTQGVVRVYAWNEQTKMDGCNRVELPFA